MALVLALLLSAVAPAGGTGVPVGASPFHRWGLSLGLGLDKQLFGPSSLSVDLEGTLRPLRHVRFGLIATAGWSPAPPADYPGRNATYRALAVIDLVVPVAWGAFFFGLGGGIHHTNLLFDEFANEPAFRPRLQSWATGATLVVRAGAEVLVRENVALGGSFALSVWANAPWIALNVYVLHPTLEARARVSVLF
ncbi:MAG: hypothetical protein Q8L48_17945 [Archangium sp.]|nr:hypothetical protein [Archangium sp.]